MKPEHNSGPPPISAGASAAKHLAEACEAILENGSSLKLEVVRDLARDIEAHLRGLSQATGESDSPGLLAEAAQRCADLATLAACNADELGGAASEAVRLAAEATEALSNSADSQPDFIRRDLRSASWKASLATRQIEESPKKS